MIEKQPRNSGDSAVDLAEELETSRRRFKTAIELAGATLYGLDRQLRYTWIINPHDRSAIERLHNAHAHETMDPMSAAIVLPAERAALETGQPQRVEFSRSVGEEVRWFDLRIEAERDAAGEISGLICAALDITERKRWEEHQRVLLMELAHRSKNALAVVQSLANQTAQGNLSIEDFKRRFFGRLQSLSRAHEILSDQNWRGAGMRELIRTQVLMYVGDAASRIRYDGPPVYLRPNAAQHVGLALHELATNAMKYGALRDDAGDVTIVWTFDSGPPDESEILTLSWRETQPDAPKPSDARNFGRILLERVVPTALEGKASLTFKEAGALYKLTIPSGELA